MLWCGQKGADELWGLDISVRQVEKARCLLSKHGFVPRLFRSPMEADCGLPKDYFDVVYSIYALGWTVDLPGTIRRIASYLKPGGSLIFSWDHPLMKCVEERDGMLVLEGCYLEDDFFSYLQKGTYPVTIQNHKMSSWINALADAGFRIVRLVEEIDPKTLEREETFSSGYYSTVRAKKSLYPWLSKQSNANICDRMRGRKTFASSFCRKAGTFPPVFNRMKRGDNCELFEPCQKDTYDWHWRGRHVRSCPDTA